MKQPVQSEIIFCAPQHVLLGTRHTCGGETEIHTGVYYGSLKKNGNT